MFKDLSSFQNKRKTLIDPLCFECRKERFMKWLHGSHWTDILIGNRYAKRLSEGNS